MRARLHVLRCAAAALLVLLLGTSAGAADARFDQVSLLNAGDRVSLVFELTGEPENVATRRVSAAVLELDAGSVIAPAKATSFMAPPGVRYVMGVSIQGGATGSRSVLKARITLLERARSVVRVVGRRVYVDFTADREPVRAVPTPRAVPAGAGQQTISEAPAPPSDPEPAATAPAVEKGKAYDAAVLPAIERFEQLGPFLNSAAASPSDAVLKAVGSTVAGIHGLLLSVDVPDESRQSHVLLLSAVAAATKAVDPAFGGDRTAEARRAMSLIERVRDR